jgi:hypothetical protein
MIGAKVEELPWLYFIHAQTSSVVPYPYSMDDPTNHSPELWILWARRTMIKLEIPVIEKRL